MKEDFLHYIWKTRQFEQRNLQGSQGEAIRILQPGVHNRDAGPDFFNARLEVDGTVWAGNVEIHLRTSDWFRHHHHTDNAYQNVILHVVHTHDMQDTTRKDAPKAPVLALKDRIPEALYKPYQNLMGSLTWIPCAHQVGKIDRFHLTHWMERLLVERLERKTGQIEKTLARNQHDWETTFYQYLARHFGLKVNATPFEMLARSLPLRTLARHKSSLFQLEALLFGQAGLLRRRFRDAYPNKLKQEYRFLQKKYKLTPLEPQVWKFLRLRPANFPTVRIAQFAALIHQSAHLVSRLLELPDVKEAEKLFAATASEYWDTHYVFEKSSVKRKKRLGKHAIRILLINTVAPFLFIYGKYKDESAYCDKAVDWLHALPAEKNRILSKWDELGVPAEHAANSQALLQLKQQYCDHKRCLDCAIGNRILQEEAVAYGGVKR